MSCRAVHAEFQKLLAPAGSFISKIECFTAEVAFHGNEKTSI
jgi:hypothetical protein